MTPMIDVAFQLIIFFMTVSQMSDVANEPLQLPRQKGSTAEKPKTLVVNVTETGEIRVSGETTTVARLLSIVTSEIKRLGDDPSKVTVVLRGDERGQSRGVNEVVTALASLGVNHVRIAVQTEARP